MDRLRTYALAATLVAAVACSSATAPERNNPGTGTNSLRVNASIEAQDAGTAYSTDYTVSVRDGTGARISGATVTIRNSAFGTVTLAETGAGSGDYAVTRADFPDGDFTLNVTRGTDNVKDVVVGGPGPFSITRPKADSTVAALQPLLVEWTTPVKAKSAQVETRDFNTVTLPDSGAFQVPGASNPARPDQRVRVWRYNEVDIAGGLTGSRFRISIRQTVEPVIVQ